MMTSTPGAAPARARRPPGLKGARVWGGDGGVVPDERDLFPLPELLPEPCGGGRRASRRRVEALRVNAAVLSLNTLYSGSSGVPRTAPARCPGELRSGHRSAMRHILDCVRRLGPPSADLSCQRAREELLAIGNEYAQPGLPHVGSRAPMKVDLLSLPQPGFRPVRLRDRLGGDAGEVLSDFEGRMKVDARVWGESADHVAEIGMFTDPVLRGPRGADLVVRLLRGGVARPRTRVGVFAVWKKPNESGPRQRLIIDCRRVNALFRDAPYTELGSLDSLVGSDCFYECQVEDALAEHFCLDYSAPAAALRTVGIQPEEFLVAGESPDIPDGELLTPCMGVLPMGFAWSFYLSQEMHAQYIQRSLEGAAYRLIVDGRPSGAWERQEAGVMAYCDNLNVGCADAERCQLVRDKVADLMRRDGFVIHEETGPSLTATVLGALLDGERGVVAPLVAADPGPRMDGHPSADVLAASGGRVGPHRLGDGHQPERHGGCPRSLRLRGPKGPRRAAVARSCPRAPHARRAAAPRPH